MDSAPNLPAVIAWPDERARVRALAAGFVATRLSEHTRRAYTQHLETWLAWCEQERVDPLAARSAHVQWWLGARQQAGDSDSTRAARLAAVGSWYQWLQREESVDRNPVTALRPEERPQPNPQPTPALSKDQAQRLLAAADRDSDRASALIALLLYTGARLGELLSADVSSLGQESGTAVLRIIGKGRKRRALPLIAPVYDRLHTYLEGRQDWRPGTVVPADRPGGVDVPLLATSTGRRLRSSQVRRDLLRCARQARLAPEVIATLTPHSTRATYATTNLANGVPLRDVQYALGHSDPRTTEGYDRSALDLATHPSSRLAAFIKPPERVVESADQVIDQHL